MNAKVQLMVLLALAMLPFVASTAEDSFAHVDKAQSRHLIDDGTDSRDHSPLTQKQESSDNHDALVCRRNRTHRFDGPGAHSDLNSSCWFQPIPAVDLSQYRFFEWNCRTADFQHLNAFIHETRGKPLCAC
jgi:hypothetical protein